MILKRLGAMGDMVMMTPAIREYKYRNPKEPIYVETLYSEVFKNSPYVEASKATIEEPNQPTINLNGCYEKNFDVHPVIMYNMAINGDEKLMSKRIEIFPDKNDHQYVDAWWDVNIHTEKPVVVMHLGTTWFGVEPSFWENVIAKTQNEFQLVLVGRRVPSKEYYPNNRKKVIDLVNKEFSIHQLACLIEKSDIFLGTDTGLIHVAGTTNTPIVGCYGIISPNVRKPFRSTIPFIPICPDKKSCHKYPCSQLNKKILANGDFDGLFCNYITQHNCVKMIDYNKVIQALQQLKSEINLTKSRGY